MYRVLILLSTFNGEKFINEQLDSLLCQREVSLDVLIRDDGSSDNTIQIIKTYQEKYPNVYLHVGNNVGASGSFLELIRMAKTQYDYYAFCDQDDVWIDNKLVRAISLLEKVNNEKPCLYYSGQKLVDKELNTLSDHLLDTQRSIHACFIFNQMAGCTAVFNNILLQSLQQYLPRNIYMHDEWVYKVCAILGGTITVDRDGLILYRQHGNNTIGLDSGIKGRLSRIKPHLLYHPSEEARELLVGYNNSISEEWRYFLMCLVENKRIKSKLSLLFNKKIVFHSVPIRMLFVIKVIFGII